ncbi:RusA family crossover junction endodeoxyribonuclease [bacterium]|nr:RusA family crossover junction endodeoxyribonuclease [bacterium]
MVKEFFVKGRPVPQGSLKFIHGRPIHARATDLAVWRADIARNAEVSGFKPVANPVSVTITFNLLKPKSTKRLFPHVKPDLDKLIRAVLDGLTGVAYVDDSQVILIKARKIYGTREGAWIGIEIIDET